MFGQSQAGALLPIDREGGRDIGQPDTRGCSDHRSGNGWDRVGCGAAEIETDSDSSVAVQNAGTGVDYVEELKKGTSKKLEETPNCE